ncbi:MAG TPA: ABC transporter ATP-binding protein [Casimicrobiaceae bacterium]|nr:ABC transporter ATP-binding protein [Casimicrobiaceae bacterium]
MPLLQVDKLTKRFDGLVANRDVSFAVDAGEIVGIIGPNGAGKSTLFNCVAGHDTPTSGSVALSGAELVGRAPEAIADLGLMRTWQIPRCFTAMSVLENTMVGTLLRCPDPANARTEAQRVLDAVGLGKRGAARAGNLNLAGQKRVDLARALATSPKILLLDEVAGGLNPAEARELVAILRAVHAGGITLVIVEHVLEVLMQLAHRVLVLDFGELIASGSPEEVVRNPAVIEAYLGRKRDA